VATTNKDFRVKNGLVVEGSTSTVNGNQVLTTASSLDSLSDVVITTPSTSQVLSYNGTNWVNSSSGGGGTTTNALTIGTGLSGTSFDGSTAVTIANTGVLSVNGSSGAITGIATTAGNLSQFAATTSSQLAGVISDETGSGALVFGTSPAITTSLTTPSTTFALINTTATTVNFAGAATTLSVGASSGTTTVNNNLAITGNLTVNGTTTTVNSTTTTVDDPIMTLGGDTSPATDDNKDRGIEFRWHNGTTAKVGFFGYDDSSGRLTFIPDATNTSEVFSGTQGDIDVNNIYINGTAATGTGGVVRATSPTLTTPSIGVATGTSFNSITGLSSTTPIANGSAAVGTATTTARADHVHPTTGLGLTSGTLAQFAATTSAQLAGVVSDETGSGSLVFATSPTLVTPSIGVATGTSFNSITGLSSTTPAALGTAAIGTGTTVARADHVHPTTGLALLSGAVFTGTVTIPSVDWGYTTTATAAGTTTLTSSSTYLQHFSGTTTQTIVLPVTSTLSTGHSYEIVNNSTGNLTINSSGGNLVATVIPGTSMAVTCIGTGLTTAANWDAEINGFNTITGTGAGVFGTAPTISNLVLSGTLTAGGATGTSGQLLSSTGSGVQWKTVSAPATGDQFLLMGA
jgi:hypothetical protein